MCISKRLIFVFCIVAICIAIFNNNCLSDQSQEEIKFIVPDRVRAIGTDDPLEIAYHENYNSIETAQEFIKTYPQERDLCAGMLLRIARLYKGKNENEKAIEVYQKIINEYANEMIPYINTYMTAGDGAFMEMGVIEKEMGNRDKALEIFDKLSNSSNSNVRNGARIQYLATKQSHLKLNAKVKLPRKRYLQGEEISGSVVVKNPEKEEVTIQCFVRARRKKGLSYGSIERIGQNEIILKPGQEYKGTFIFESNNRFEPNTWVIDCDLNGVTVKTNTITIKIVDKENGLVPGIFNFFSNTFSLLLAY